MFMCRRKNVRNLVYKVVVVVVVVDFFYFFFFDKSLNKALLFVESFVYSNPCLVMLFLYVGTLYTKN